MAVDPAYVAGTSAAEADPTAVDRAAAAVWVDELGELDGLLVRSGVRWDLVRWLPRSCRWRLALAIRRREMPAGTRTCWEGREPWLDEVRRRVAVQEWYACRKEIWLRAAEYLAASVPRDRRPLTQVTVDELAKHIGRSDRYVRMILSWYAGEGLLGQVVVGTRYPRMEAPQDETEQERQAREAAAQAAQQALADRRRRARVHAQAELAARRTGQAPVPLSDGLESFRRGGTADPDDEPGARLVHIASVYELRVPAPVDDMPPTSPPVPGGPEGVVVDLAAARTRRSQPASGPVSGSPERATPAADPALTSANPENFRPIGNLELMLNPNGVGGVDKEGGASRRSDTRGVSAGQEGQNQSASHRSWPERVAAALLGRSVETWAIGQALPAKLTHGVSIRWLAALIRPHVTAGWTIPELAWQILTRGGQYPHLPQQITNPGGWIRAAVRANPAIRPALVAELEDDNRRAAARRELVIRQQDLERGRAAQAARDACQWCDEHGWVRLDGGGPAVRCDHQAPPLAEPAGAGASAGSSGTAEADTVGTGRRRWDAVRQQLLTQARTHQQPTATSAPVVPPAEPRYTDALNSDQRWQRAIERARQEKGGHRLR